MSEEMRTFVICAVVAAAIVAAGFWMGMNL